MTAKEVFRIAGTHLTGLFGLTHTFSPLGPAILGVSSLIPEDLMVPDPMSLECHDVA